MAARPPILFLAPWAFNPVNLPQLGPRIPSAGYCFSGCKTWFALLSFFIAHNHPRDLPVSVGRGLIASHGCATRQLTHPRAFWWSTWRLGSSLKKGGCRRPLGLTIGIHPQRFRFVMGTLLLSAAVAVNWKCQTCRLSVASRVCVINWTSLGTPTEGSCPSATRKTQQWGPDSAACWRQNQERKLIKFGFYSS